MDMEVGMSENLITCLKPEHQNPDSGLSDFIENHMKCFIHCVSTKMGFYDRSTGWNKDLIVDRYGNADHMNMTEIRSDVERCIENFGKLPDECESTTLVHDCFNSLKKKYGSSQTIESSINTDE